MLNSFLLAFFPHIKGRSHWSTGLPRTPGNFLVSTSQVLQTGMSDHAQLKFDMTNNLRKIKYNKTI